MNTLLISLILISQDGGSEHQVEERVVPKTVKAWNGLLDEALENELLKIVIAAEETVVMVACDGEVLFNIQSGERDGQNLSETDAMAICEIVDERAWYKDGQMHRDDGTGSALDKQVHSKDSALDKQVREVLEKCYVNATKNRENFKRRFRHVTGEGLGSETFFSTHSAGAAQMFYNNGALQEYERALRKMDNMMASMKKLEHASTSAKMKGLDEMAPGWRKHFGVSAE